jgi:hypothetical protein
MVSSLLSQTLSVSSADPGQAKQPGVGLSSYRVNAGVNRTVGQFFAI